MTKENRGKFQFRLKHNKKMIRKLLDLYAAQHR